MLTSGPLCRAHSDARELLHSCYDDHPGGAAAEYKVMADKAAELAGRQERRVDPEYHD